MCYAYLSDVPYINELQVDITSLAKSRWFTRGWTLQELIAPHTVLFYSRCWHEIGTKSSLRTIIVKTARIHDKALSGAALENFSIAQKMSWASARQTTRIEDLAYSLMGIFNVHMPMLYGEGRRAFFRLQEEIIKRTNDQTIFAWRQPNLHDELGGLLAYSPAAFHASYDIIREESPPAANSDTVTNAGEFSITNKGLFLSFPLKIIGGALTVILECRSRDRPNSMISVRLYGRGHNLRTSANLYNVEGYKRKGDDRLDHISSERITFEYSVRPIYAQIEFIPSTPTELVPTPPKSYLIQSSRFTSLMRLMVKMPEKIYFQPQINMVTNFHYLGPDIGRFTVKVSLSFVWKKLRVEVLNQPNIPPAKVLELEEHEVMSTERTWYSHPNAEDLATEPPDRIIWSLPGDTHLLLIAIRSKLIGGLKMQEVELDLCERLPSSHPGSPLHLQANTPRPSVQPESFRGSAPK